MAMRNAAKRLHDVSVPVNMHAEGDTLVIGIGAAPDNSDKRSATIWLAIAKDEATVAISRGENRGKTLSYYHPVRELTPIGMWEGEAMTLRLPLKDLKTMGGDCLVALLQVENAGPILGAAQYDRLSRRTVVARRKSRQIVRVELNRPPKQRAGLRRPA